MLKAEMLDRFNYKCEHRQNGWNHPACYHRDRKEAMEKVGCFDIETSNLKANFGIMLSWAIYYPQTGETIYDHITPGDIRKGTKDARIVSSACDELRGCDRVITHYGTRFDIPFVRTRALYWKRKRDANSYEFSFPGYGEVYHTDVWRIAKAKLCLHSNRQGAIGETILGYDEKTRIHPDIWLDMSYGNPKQRQAAIEYIIDHNVKDVSQLAGNFEALLPYVHLRRTSI